MNPKTLTAANFAKETEAGLTVVDFWAKWCGPCRMMSPVLDEVAAAYPQIRFGKVNVDEQPALASAFRVDAIPTLLILRNGQALRRSVGLLQKPALQALIEEVLQA